MGTVALASVATGKRRSGPFCYMIRKPEGEGFSGSGYQHLRLLFHVGLNIAVFCVF